MVDRKQASDGLIREGTLLDAHAIARLMTEIGYPTSYAQMRERLSEILRRPNHEVFVAELSGVVIGMVGAFVGRRYESDEPYGQVLALVVARASQRRGVGTRLLKTAERWLVDRGAGCVIVHCGKQRADAHRFYARLGYHATGLRLVKSAGELLQ